MNFYFYDLETFGISPRTARIAQFAGVRTDENFNILAKEMFYCQPTKDSLPDPEACLVTGISPQLCQEKGLPEYQFMQKILAEFSQGNICVLGYNNIRFDDEFVRFGAWRNLLNPYAWAYKDGNSRFDLLDVVRFCYALKPNNSLNWVYDEESGQQTPSFKLDRLAPANNIEHSDAHDALADVIATIEIAKKIKQTQPKLWDYVFSLRHKKTVAGLIKPLVPILHTSGMYPAVDACTKLTTALAYHPEYKDRVIVYNLAQNPQILLDLSIDELKNRLFTKQNELADGTERLQLKILQFNKSPMFVASQKPPSQLNIDRKTCLKHLQFIKHHHPVILNKVLAIYQEQVFENDVSDADQQLYDGFVHTKDRQQLDKMSQLNAQQIQDYPLSFSDKRLPKLVFYYKARNFPKILTEQEQETWFEIVQSRLQEGVNGYLSFEAYFKKIDVLQQHYPKKALLWQQLHQYSEQFL